MSEPRPIPDQRARDLIEQRLEVNLLVEAGAGSGKTECLARRMAAGIVDGRYRVEEMAAVTFTRKAAAELRGRFQLTLERALAAERDEARRDRLRRALRHLERLFAGTIHAFCAHLLRERPVEAGVAPGFTEMDDVADLEQRRRAWREFLDRERAVGSPLLQELLDTGVTPRDLDDSFATVCDFPEVEFPTGEAPRPDPVPARQALETFWKALNDLLAGDIAPDTTCKVQQRMRELRGRLRVAALDEPRELAELIARWEKHPGIVQNRWADDARGRRAAKERIDALFGDLHAVALPFLAAWRQYVYRLAIALLLASRDHAEQARRRALTLNYGDLLQHAAALLRDNIEVRRALQQRYRWLFVDEFQDTDPIQAEVMVLLAGAESAERDWTRVPLRAGALFIVGDPKQSIYRFRRADIDTYLRVRQRISETGGQVAELTASFRSLPALCDWANTVFGGLLPVEATPQQPAFHGLAPVRPGDGAAGGGVRVIAIPESAEADDVAGADAGTIARFIRSEIDAGRRKPGDFLILTRIRKALPVYARALEAHQLAVEVSGGAAFARSPAVTGLAELLHALADPDDGPAVVGVLRGPLFGLSDPELFSHRTAGGGFLITAPGLDELPGPVGEALRALREMYRWTRILPAGAAAERILEATGRLAMTAAASPSGAEAGDLLHAVDRVRQVAEEGGTLADAADALVQDLESTEVESLPLEPGRSDVVRLMNLHKAKGLEAPVVFLADPLKAGMTSADVRIVRDGLRALGYFQISRARGEHGSDVLGEPAGWARHAQEELAYVEAEQRRLLYVAATRARDLLVVSRWAKARSGHKRPWKDLDPYLAHAPALEVPAPRPPQALPLPDLGAAARAAAGAAREARRRVLAEPSWLVESVTATAHRAAPFGHPVQAGRTREPDTGMAWGTLVHALLEHAMRGPARDRAHLERVANWLTLDNGELRRVVPEALDTVEGVMASELWQRVLAAEARHVEVPLAVRRDVDVAPPRVLYGVIDLAFKTAAGWSLVDYKTDQGDTATLTAKYREQARHYAQQWAGFVEGAVTDARLYSIRQKELSANLAARTED